MQVAEILTNKLSNNVNDNVVKPINIKHKPQTKTIVEVKVIAENLANELGSSTNLKYYYKVAWKLPEHLIWSNLEAALNGKSPQKLFTWLCEQSMVKSS